MTLSKVNVRFAPSPTGPLHIGGLRTALYNYLFAKKYKGTFILRIEDTDQNRRVAGAEAYIVESLKWCNIYPDESPDKGGMYAPYHQSKRREIYAEYIQKLIANGKAYYAFDTSDELNRLRKEAESKGQTFSYNIHIRNKLKNALHLSKKEVQKLLINTPYVIRFRIPEDKVVEMNDLVRGKIQVETNTLDDKILFKSDGLPTYHFANVVDDHLMKISHVIRGEEWLPSLPLHVLLYEAMGWEHTMPQFAHLPLILKPKGKGKLSKRDGEKMGFPIFPIAWKSPNSHEQLNGYRDSGYLPEALINILALLGWNPGIEQEIFSLEELIQLFDFKGIQKSGSRFNLEKARWFNHQHLQRYPNKKIAQQVLIELKKKDIDATMAYTRKVCELLKERINFIHEIVNEFLYFFQPPEKFDSKAIKKFVKKDTPYILDRVKKLLLDISSDFDSTQIESRFKSWIESEQIGYGKVMNPLRLAMTGALKGPHLFDIIALLGKKRTVERVNRFLDIIG